MTTLLDMDTPRDDGDAYAELGNGLAVRLTIEPDQYAEASYPGSTLWWAHEAGEELVEEFDEEFSDLPFRHRIAIGQVRFYLPVDPAYLHRLVVGKIPAGVPRFVVARWASMYADRMDPAECYAQTFVGGLLSVKIQVEVDGSPQVVRSIEGLPSGFANFGYLQAAIDDAVAETLGLLEGEDCEYRNPH
jgi:hypothetical protein